MTSRRSAKAALPYTDLDPRRWKEYVEREEDPIWTDSLWLIPARARGNGHRLDYHGNFVPQIATQTFLRFTRPEEVVLDLFLGSGTSAIEAVRLGRRCLGVELREDLTRRVSRRLAAAIPERVQVLCGDSTAPETGERIREALARWGREDGRAELLMLHPPYGDIIRFSDRRECLSNARTPAEFLERFRLAAGLGYRHLRPGRFAVLVIGDRYRNGALVPLGFECMRVMTELGFRPRSIVVKNIEGNEIGKGRATNLWRYRALRGGFYIFKHEYVMIFDRPESSGRERQARASDPTGSP